MFFLTPPLRVTPAMAAQRAREDMRRARLMGYLIALR